MGSKRAAVLLVITVLAVAACTWGLAALPPVPIPPENAITEPKRLLGKILFWDEQLSSDSTVACGSCHSPGVGGSDGRIGVNPGPDTIFGGPDDIFGSPGVVSRDSLGLPDPDPLFGLNPQVTRRSANPVVDSAFVPQAFWDGRAGSQFLDPRRGPSRSRAAAPSRTRPSAPSSAASRWRVRGERGPMSPTS
jgi:cytochrome c peroxidase